jgi:signal transduction histidine kinase
VTVRLPAALRLRGAAAEGELDPTNRSAVRRALSSYVVFSLIALTIASGAAVFFSGTLARHQAERDAERVARAVATGIVAPLTTPEFRARDPEALALMSQTMELRTLDGSIEHVKIWGDAGGGFGTILWASQKPLVGRNFPMEPEEYALFGTSNVVSSVSDLDKEENELESVAGTLVEVYVGVQGIGGQDLLFESYTSTEGLAENTRALVLEIVPLPLTALLLLTLMTLPLAVSLARRVDAGQFAMRRLLVNAVASSDHERRRIAQDLHDGVLQDLAGVSYALASDARQIPTDSELRGHMDQASTILRGDVASLRHLMDDIYPPDLEARGLPGAIRDLVAMQDFGGAEVAMEIDDSLAPSPLSARITLRVTRELLRNITKHAQATHVVIGLRQVHQTLYLEVSDDGVGFDQGQGEPEGHFGMRLVKETVADAGGDLTIESHPGQGTVVRAELPA